MRPYFMTVHFNDGTKPKKYRGVRVVRSSGGTQTLYFGDGGRVSYNRNHPNVLSIVHH